MFKLDNPMNSHTIRGCARVWNPIVETKFDRRSYFRRIHVDPVASRIAHGHGISARGAGMSGPSHK